MATEKRGRGERGHDLPSLATPVCSVCGGALKSPYEGIALDNGIVYCARCYQAFLFPYMHTYDTEIPDEVR